MLSDDFRFDPRVPAWEMQPGEASKAFYYFAVFRDLGPTRTVRKCAEALANEEAEYRVMSREDKAVRLSEIFRTISEHSAKRDWIARSRAYDAAMDHEALQARLIAHRQAVLDAGTRHAQLTGAMLTIPGRFLEKFVRDEAFRNARIDEMTHSELMAYVKSGIVMERLVLGMDTSAEAAVNADRAGQTPTSQDELKRIAREAAIEAKSREPSPDIEIKPPKE